MLQDAVHRHEFEVVRVRADTEVGDPANRVRRGPFIGDKDRCTGLMQFHATEGKPRHAERTRKKQKGRFSPALFLTPGV